MPIFPRLLAALTTASALLAAPAAIAGGDGSGGNPPAFSTLYTLRATFQTPEGPRTTFFGHGTDALLGDLFYFDDYDRQPLACDGDTCRPESAPVDEHDVCVAGDINRVCSLLSELSRNDVAAYRSGDHISTRLVGCRVAGRGRPVIARFEMIHDWADYRILVETEISRCAPADAGR
jgi:hypothetical protein